MFNLKIRKEQLFLTGSHTSKQSSQAMAGYFLCDTIRYPPGSTAYIT